MLRCTHTSSLYVLLAMEFSHCRDPYLCQHAGFRCENTERLSTLFALVTLTLTWWPVLSGDGLGVHMWTAYVNSFKSYHVTGRQTESTKIITVPLRGWSTVVLFLVRFLELRLCWQSERKHIWIITSDVHRMIRIYSQWSPLNHFDEKKCTIS